MANLVEDHSRRLLFMHNLMKNGGDVLNAAERVKMFLFDYGALTAFERKVLRRFIPFYTFTRKNLALQAEMIVRRPGQFAVQANFIDMVQQLSGEEPATAEELAKTYEHTQRGARVLLSRGRNGQAMWMNSLGNPAQQAVDTITEGGFGFLKQLHPVPKSWFELRSGYRFFSGRNVRDSVRIPDIGRFLAEDTPEGRLMPDDFRKFMHRFVEFRNKGTKSRPDYVSEKPHNAYLVHNLPGFTRLWSEYRKVLSYVQEEDRDFLQPSSLKKGSFTLAGKVVLGLQFSELDRDDADRLDTFFQAEMDYPKDTARERTREMRREGLDTSFEEELANILGPGKQGDPSGRLDIPGAR
jgi:hypothetical protein